MTIEEIGKKEKKLMINFSKISPRQKVEYIRTVLWWDDRIARGLVERYGAMYDIMDALSEKGVRGDKVTLRIAVDTIRRFIRKHKLTLETEIDLGSPKDTRRTARAKYLASSRTGVKGTARANHEIGLVANNVPRSHYRKPYRKSE